MNSLMLRVVSGTIIALILHFALPNEAWVGWAEVLAAFAVGMWYFIWTRGRLDFAVRVSYVIFMIAVGFAVSASRLWGENGAMVMLFGLLIAASQAAFQAARLRAIGAKPPRANI